MSLQLILGNSGSGKSYELYKHIITASVQSPGTRFLVIVPEQFTMQTQKELVRLHPRKGILNIDILSFQRLAHRIFEEVGADLRTVLEDTGKTLMLRRAATRHREELRVLKGNLNKKGYLAQIKSLISEFAQYDIDQEKMNQMLEVSKERPQLYYKLQDLDILYRGFEEELAGKYITAEETLEALCQVAGQSEILKDSVIVLDGFTGFTPIQHKLLRELLVLAKEFYVTVTIDTAEDYLRIYGEHELFYLSKKTIRSLSHMAQECGCEIREPWILENKVQPRFCRSRELAHLEKNIFRTKRKVYREKINGDISVHTAASPAQESHYVARTIRSLVKNGYRYSQIAIITGDLADYADELPHVFQEYDIPIFMDSRRAVFSNPYIELLRAVLDLAGKDQMLPGIFRILRTGMCGLAAEDVDILENYTLAAGMKSHGRWKKEFDWIPEGFTMEQCEKCEEMRRQIMETLEENRKILRSSKTTVREKTTALYQLGCVYKVQTQLEQYASFFEEKGELDMQKEYEQVYQLVMDLFDKMVELLGEEKMTLAEYTELLETGFEELRVGIIPPSMDRVQVGDIERTRLKDIRALFFMGLNDGWVPGSGNGGGMLSQMERETLEKSRVELAPTARQESYIQKFYLYQNLTKPSEKLYLSYCKGTSDGSAMRPSYVIRMVTRLFPEIQVKDEDYTENLLKRAVTTRSGITLMAEGLQNIRETSPSAAWMELYQWYRKQENWQEQTEDLVHAAFLRFDESGIGKAAASKLYGEILSNSVSRLEKFASCAFAHFLQYGLQLKERQEYEFHPVDMGSVTHRIIELFSRKVELEEGSWEGLTEETRNRLIDECVDQVAEEYGHQILHSSARNEFMIERLRRILRRTAWALQKQILAGSFRPAGYEVSFTQVADLDAVNIALSEEEKMRLKGKIDRIDICEKDGEVYIKVIDYKSGNKSFDLVALYYGLQLQLVVYLNAAVEMEQRIHKEKEIIPAGIFYYHVKDPMLTGKDTESAEAISAELLKELKLTGLVSSDKKVYREMDQYFAGTSDVIPVAENKDGTLSKRSKAVKKEQFHTLSSFVQEKMKELGRRMLDGEIAAVPFERKTQTGCDYCIYRSICRMDPKLPGTHYRRLKEYSEEMIWKKMENQEDGNELDQ